MKSQAARYRSKFFPQFRMKLTLLLVAVLAMIVSVAWGEETRQTSHGVLALLSPGNLIRNAEYEFGKPGDFSTLERWELSPGDGWAFDKSQYVPRYWYVFFLSRDGAADLKQKNIPLEKNTWYRVETRYQTTSPEQIQSRVGEIDLQSVDNDTGDLKNYPYYLGPAGKWVTAGTYYYNGQGTSVDYNIMLRVPNGKAYIGKVEVRKTEEQDFNRQILLDPGLDASSVGSTSVDWDSYTPSFPVIESVAGAPNGKNCLKLPLPTTSEAWDNRMFLRQRILARHNDTVKVDFWAKADANVFTQLAVRTTLSKYYYMVNSTCSIGPEWKKYSFSFTLQPGDTSSQGGDDLFKKYPELSYDLLLMFKANSDQDRKVWFSDMSAEIVGRRTSSKESLSKFAENLPLSRKDNLLLNGSFESGMAGWGSNIMHIPLDLEWQKRPFPNCYVDTENAVLGHCSLKLENIYHGNSVNTGYFPVDALEGQKYAFSVWVKADKPCDINPVIGDYYGGREGKILSLSLKYSTPGEWKRLSASEVWGEYKAGFAHLKLYVNVKDGKPGDQVTVWLDGAQFQAGELTDYQSSFGDFEVGLDVTEGTLQSFKKGEPGHASLYVRNNLPEKKRFKMEKQVRGSYNTVIERQEEYIEVPANETVIKPVTLDTSKSGSFLINYQMTDQGTGLSVRSLDESYAVFPPLENIPAEQSLMGMFFPWTGAPHAPVSIHRKRATGDSEAWFKILRLSNCGVENSYELGVFRVFYPEEGKFQVPAVFDWYVNKLREYGMRLTVSLGSWLSRPDEPEITHVFPKWSLSERQVPPQSDHLGHTIYYPKLEYWRDFVSNFLTHFKGRIDIYGCFPERGLTDPLGVIDYYKILHEEAQKIDPAIKILGPSMPGYTFPTGKNDWVDHVFENGLDRYIDIFSYDGYGVEMPEDTPYGPDDVWVEKYPQWYFSHYGRKPMWDAEWWHGCSRQPNWETYPFDVTGSYNTRGDLYATQAATITRHCVMLWAAGTEVFMYFSPWFNEIGERALTFITNGRQVPLPGWISYSVVCNKLGQGKFVKKIRLGDTLVYVYEKHGKPNAVYFNFKAKEGVRIALNLNPDGLTVDDIMKNTIAPERTPDGAILLPLSMDAVYVTSGTMKMDVFIKAFENASLKGLNLPPELRVTLARVGAKPAVAAVIKNPSGEPLNGTLRIDKLPAGWTLKEKSVPVIVPPNQEKIVSIPADISLCEGETLEGSFASAWKEVKDIQPASLCAATKSPGEVMLDGQITEAEYGSARPFLLNSPLQVGYYVGADSTTPCRWDGEKDVSAKCRAVWNDNNVYFGLEIKDDLVFPSKSEAIHRGDSFELYFNSDPLKDIFSEAYTERVGKFYIGPADKDGPAKISWRGELGGLHPNNVEGVYRKTPDGYNLEICVPLVDNLSVNDVWGFDARVLDFDPGRKDVMNLDGFKSGLTWSGGEHYPERNKKVFGFIIFQ